MGAPSNQQQHHLKYLQQCIELAVRSPPKATNFRVGCVIVSYPATGSVEVLSTGYTLELEGNTHAEQCALSKLATKHDISETDLGELLRPELNVTLYTSLEPCGKRLSGNLPCVQRIVATTQSSPVNCGIRKVVFGAKEPGTFVQNSRSCELLTEAGIVWEYLSDLEDEILLVAMEGHTKKPEHHPQSHASSNEQQKPPATGTSIDNIDDEERRRQQALPRNPKKRMMETVPNTRPETS